MHEVVRLPASMRSLAVRVESVREGRIQRGFAARCRWAFAPVVRSLPAGIENVFRGEVGIEQSLQITQADPRRFEAVERHDPLARYPRSQSLD